MVCSTSVTVGVRVRLRRGVRDHDYRVRMVGHYDVFVEVDVRVSFRQPRPATRDLSPVFVRDASRRSPRFRRRARDPGCKRSRNTLRPWCSRSPSNGSTAAHIVRHAPSWSIYRHTPRTPLMERRFANHLTEGWHCRRDAAARNQAVGAVREPPNYVPPLTVGTPNVPRARGHASPPRPPIRRRLRRCAGVCRLRGS